MHPQHYYNVTKARFILFVWAGVQTYSLLTLRQTGGPFTPPYLTILHSSRVNIIYGVDPCFFPAEPIMKEPILHFLPLLHSASHSDFWTDGWNFFHFLPFFKAWDKLPEP